MSSLNTLSTTGKKYTENLMVSKSDYVVEQNVTELQDFLHFDNHFVSCHWSLSIPPENIRKPFVF